MRIYIFFPLKVKIRKAKKKMGGKGSGRTIHIGEQNIRRGKGGISENGAGIKNGRAFLEVAATGCGRPVAAVRLSLCFFPLFPFPNTGAASSPSSVELHATLSLSLSRPLSLQVRFLSLRKLGRI